MPDNKLSSIIINRGCYIQVACPICQGRLFVCTKSWHDFSKLWLVQTWVLSEKHNGPMEGFSRFLSQHLISVAFWGFLYFLFKLISVTTENPTCYKGTGKACFSDNFFFFKLGMMHRIIRSFEQHILERYDCFGFNVTQLF